jgi:DNA-binding MarR family transcriptional regulator
MEFGEETPARLRALPSRLLAQVATRADRLVGDGLGDEGARKYHYALLAALEEFGPASQSTLSRRTGIYRSDLVATINELDAKELVERAPDPEDGRRNVITLTRKGREHLERLDDVVGEIQNDLLKPLSKAERAEFVRLLQRLVGERPGRR